jgi:hypothetical protein
LSRACGAARLAPALLALVLAASCAPPPRPVTDRDAFATRYAAACSRREALMRAFTSDVVVRLDGRATGRLPALSATIALASPDRARVRAAALVGVAFDLLVTRDSIRAWVPSQRLALAAPVESLGLAEPAALAARVLGATWAPPAEAWRAAVADSTSWRVGWREGQDSLALDVDADALPREARLVREHRVIRVRYSSWTRLRGEPFPDRCELADDAGWARVRIDGDELHAEPRPDEGWFEPRRSPARLVSWGDLRALLARRGQP